jgi:hypothetical protein
VHDLSSGEFNGKTNIIQGFGCNKPLGSRHLLTLRSHRGDISYLDIEQGKLYHLRNIRPGCVNAVIAADGVLNSPSMGNGCFCSFSLLTSFAMVHMPEIAEWAGTTPLKATPPPVRVGR